MFVKKDRKQAVLKSKPLDSYSTEDLHVLLDKKRALQDNKALRESLPDKGAHIMESITNIEKILKARESGRLDTKLSDKSADKSLESQLEGMTIKDRLASTSCSSSSSKVEHIPVREIPNPFQKIRELTPEELKFKERKSRERDELVHGKRGLKLREKRNVRTIRVLTTEESMKLYEERKKEEHEQMIKEARERLLKATPPTTTAPLPPVVNIAGPYRNPKLAADVIDSDSEDDEDARGDRFDELELPEDDDDDEDRHDEEADALHSDHD